MKAPSILGTSAPDFLSGFTPLAFPFNKKVSRKTAVCFLLGLSPLALPFNKKVFHRTVDYWFCSGVSPLSLSPPKGIPQGSGSGWCTPYWCIPLPYDSRRCDLQLLTHCLVGYLREKERLRRKPKRNLFPSIHCLFFCLLEIFCLQTVSALV